MIGPLAQAIREAGWVLLLRAYAGRRTRRIGVGSGDDPGDDRFLQELFVASGGNLAVAAGFLPAASRREARAAFLICRALDAFEDLGVGAACARDGIGGVLDYLVRGGATPPSTAGLAAVDDAEVVELCIAQHLPALRRELLRLGAAARERVHALATDMAQAMLEFAGAEDRDDHRGAARYGSMVLGRAARYALRLSGLRSPWPIDYGAIGRVVQAANLLRDAEKDCRSRSSSAPRDPYEARLRAILEALEAAPAVPGALAELSGPALSGARAAVAYMAATTASFYVRQLGLPRPAWLSRPLLAAMLAFLSGRAYRAFCGRLDDLVLDLVVHGAPGVRGGGPRRTGERRDALRARSRRRFDCALAMRHPVEARALALHRMARLAHVALAACDVFPPTGRQDSAPESADTLLGLDYLLACAMRDAASLGNRALEEFSAAIAKLAMRAKSGDGPVDPDGVIVEFLAATVGRAQGMAGEALARWVEAQRATARALGAPRP